MIAPDSDEIGMPNVPNGGNGPDRTTRSARIFVCISPEEDIRPTSVTRSCQHYMQAFGHPNIWLHAVGLAFMHTPRDNKAYRLKCIALSFAASVTLLMEALTSFSPKVSKAPPPPLFGFIVPPPHKKIENAVIPISDRLRLLR